MRMCKDLTEASSMEEITAELKALGAARKAIRDTYLNASELDPDFVKLNEYYQQAVYYMRMKAGY
jgi:hypothetical protein